jgi:NTP pyrophosphatase (non-canonical NTP hydrolase)
MAIVGEAGELAAEFQWLSPEESSEVMRNPQAAAAVRDEIADVAIYLIRLVTGLGVDLEAAIRDKVSRNGVRFPE